MRNAAEILIEQTTTLDDIRLMSAEVAALFGNDSLPPAEIDSRVADVRERIHACADRLVALDTELRDDGRKVFALDADQLEALSFALGDARAYRDDSGDEEDDREIDGPARKRAEALAEHFGVSLTW